MGKTNVAGKKVSSDGTTRNWKKESFFGSPRIAKGGPSAFTTQQIDDEQRIAEEFASEHQPAGKKSSSRLNLLDPTRNIPGSELAEPTKRHRPRH